jgi:LTXXQ motif family protein
MMKTALAVSVVFSIGTLLLPLFAKARTISDDLRPPPIEITSSSASLLESVSNAMVARRTLPRGPNDLVRDYDAEMEAVSRRLTGELASISEAAEKSEITGEQAEQISKEGYRVASTQFQLLIALHANLEREIDRTRRIAQKDSNPARAHVSAVVALPFSSLQLNPTLTQYLQLTPSQAVAIEEVMFNERRNFEPMMAELRATSQKLFLANQQGDTNGKDVHALATSQATILSKLIVANSRMQAKIYAILDQGQRKKLDDLKQGDEVSVVGEE